MGFVTCHVYLVGNDTEPKYFVTYNILCILIFFFSLLQNEWGCSEPDWFASGWWIAQPDEGVQHSTCCRAWSRFDAFTITVCQGKMYHKHCLIRRSCVTAAYFREEILSSQFSSVYSQSTNNKMPHFTIYFFLKDALHVSGGFSILHQELETHIQRQVFVRPLPLPAASLASSR